MAFISVNPVNPIGAYHDLGYSVTTSETQSILMAKGATSKDKKSGGKGKGKVEETVDKGGKVRTLLDPFLCTDLEWPESKGLKAATAVNVRHILCEKHSKATEALQRIQVRCPYVSQAHE